jgi:general secretion pathway protein D
MKRPPLSTPIVSLLVATFAVVQPVTVFGQVQATAERELQRRMQRENQGREESEKGRAALRSKDFEAAFAHYKNACAAIADAPATKAARATAVGGLTESSLRLAEQRITEGYYVSAVEALKEALKHNPDSKPIHKLLANIEAPDIFNKKMTPGFRAKVEEVKQGHLDAQQYQELGRYDLADKEAQKILNLDKYNKGAELRRQAVAEEKSDFAEVAYNSARAQAMWEVGKEWQRPYRRFDKRTIEITEKSKSSAPSTVKIGKKLNSIIIPKIDFRDSTVRETIEFLVKKSKELDDEKEGVNIVLKIEGGAAPIVPAAAPAADPAGLIPGLDAAPAAPAAPAPAPLVGGSGDTRITLTLNNVPLIEALKYITTLANLKFKIDPFAVTVVPIGTDTTEMFTKEWKVRPDFLTRIPGGGGGGAGLGAVTPDGGAGAGGVAPLGSAMTAKDTLIAAGVQFPPGSIAIYSKSTSTLTVKNSSENLDLIEKIVESLESSAGVTQVEIQAKFVEITQNNLKELSFDWMLGQSNLPGVSTNSLFTAGGTRGTLPQTNPADFVFLQGGAPIGSNPVTGGNRSGSLAISANAIDALLFGGAGTSAIAPGIFSLVGARTDPQFQLVMRGLDQKKGVDLLSAPRVTTKPGQQAVIEIIREFRYPTEFEQPQIPQNFGGNNNNGGGGLAGLLGGGGGGSFPVTPTTPTTFEVKNTGVTLQVEPQIGPDGYSIDMNLAPQVVEFEGFINYGSPIQSTSTNALGQQVVNVITPNVINQPIFATRKVTTNVTVFDGATVVLGGLVREDVQSVEDKTPIIGDVPLVGRLFRSKVDQHIKRNLIIFVTAKLVNPAGDLVTSEDEIEEKVDALPLPDIAPAALPDISGFRK